jgi:hypothetical protein
VADVSVSWLVGIARHKLFLDFDLQRIWAER